MSTLALLPHPETRPICSRHSTSWNSDMKETHYSRHPHAIHKPVYYILLTLTHPLSIIETLRQYIPEEPGAAKSSQNQPGAVRSSQKQPGAAQQQPRGSQEQPGAASCSQVQPRGAQNCSKEIQRIAQRHPRGPRGAQEEPESRQEEANISPKSPKTGQEEPKGAPRDAQERVCRFFFLNRGSCCMFFLFFQGPPQRCARF